MKLERKDGKRPNSGQLDRNGFWFGTTDQNRPDLPTQISSFYLI